MRDATSTDRIEAMVQCIEPTWRVRDSTPATGGYHLVYRLQLDTGEGVRRCVLKATPADADPVCGDEARLLSVLATHSPVEVPGPLGVVDSHDTLPAPFFLAEELQGANYRRSELGSLDNGTLERAARSLGRRLEGLHRASGDSEFTLEGFGFVGIDPDGALDGGRPSGRAEQVVVDDAETDWRSYLHGTVEHAVGALRDTRFAATADDLEAVLSDRIERLSGPFSPALCRVDHSIENTVLDPKTDEVRALLDWEFCVAATPAYDLAFAVDSFSGGLLALVPGEPVPSESIESALLAGYRDAGGEEAVKAYRENGDCYRLLSDMHAMVNFEDWFDQSAATATQQEAAADPLRERVRRRIRTCR